MQVHLQAFGRRYTAQLSRPTLLGKPLAFDGQQPQHFGVATAKATAYVGGGFVGDVRQGGSCNCAVVTFTPHCNGLHTETAGHLCAYPLPLSDVLADSAHFPAIVISLPARTAAQAAELGDDYTPAFLPDDLVLCAADLHAALARYPDLALAYGAHEAPRALIVRTLPNSPDKPLRNFDAQPAPFFSRQAMQHIAGLPIRHLLVDLPSIDRAHDEGRLSNHRQFWQMPATGTVARTDVGMPLRTITEFAYVPDNLPDGRYLLNLQAPGFELDAAPSRALLWPLRPEA